MKVLFLLCLQALTFVSGHDHDTPSLGDRMIASIGLQSGMPQTATAAEAQNWTVQSACQPQFGRRAQFGRRLAPTLLFDNLGNLAGFQMSVNSSTYPMYPKTNLKSPLVIQLEEFGFPQEAAISLYFKDPAMICSAADPVEGSIGDRLWARKSTDCNTIECFESYPLSESEVLNDDVSVYPMITGGCLPSGTPFGGPGSPGMGQHYWGNVSRDVACEETGPIFLLYDQGKLNAMGIAFVGLNNEVPTIDGILPSGFPPAAPAPNLWEFARQPLFPFFFNEEDNPICMSNINTFNDSLPSGTTTTGTMHIFFSDNSAITCAAPTPATPSEAPRKTATLLLVAALGAAVQFYFW